MYVKTVATWAALAVKLTSLLDSSKANERGVLLRIETGLDGTYNSATNTHLKGAGGQVPTIRVNTAGHVMDGELLPSKLRKTLKKTLNRATVDSDAKGFEIVTKSNQEIRSLDIRMDAFRNGIRGPKISLNDEICLVSLVWTPRDSRPNYDSRRGAITGDLMAFCDYSWYPSGKVYHGYELRCGWLDGGNSSGSSVKGLHLDLDKLGKGFVEAFARDHPDESSSCSNGVRFHPGDLPPSKRSVAANSKSCTITTNTSSDIILTPKDAFGNQAFLSNRVSAIELCKQPLTYGPSMVNTKEGIFCDMTTKKLVPMCNSTRTKGCMDYSRFQKRVHPALYRNLDAKDVPDNLISFDSFQIEYFTLTDVNGPIIDDGEYI
ncbi:unnamed protein product [Mortierella alpina]